MKSIGVNEIRLGKESMDLAEEKFTLTVDIEFGNVWDKNDIQFIMKSMKDKLTVDNLIKLMKSENSEGSN